MDVKEVRLKRLEQLLSEHDNNKAALARTLKKAPAQVSQWFSGIRTITEDTAREIEVLVNRPSGWMDTVEGDPAASMQNIVVLDEALRALEVDARKEALDFIRYKLERARSTFAAEQLRRYMAAIDTLVAEPTSVRLEKRRR